MPGPLLFLPLALVIFISLPTPGLGSKTSPCPLASMWAQKMCVLQLQGKRGLGEEAWGLSAGSEGGRVSSLSLWGRLGFCSQVLFLRSLVAPGPRWA